MTFEIALSLFTFASVFIFAHIQIRKNHNSVLKKIEDDKKKIEKEMNIRLNFIEDRQLQSLKISVNQIESKQLIQQDALEEIKIKITKNGDDSNNEIKSLQCQIQKLTQHLEKLQKKASENSSLESLQNQNQSEESDEIEYTPFRKIKGLDEIDDLARAIKQNYKEKSEGQALTNVTIKTEDISKIEKSEPNFTDNAVELDAAITVDDKLEVESIKEPKTTSILEVNDQLIEAETDFNLEIAACSVKEIEPDCQLIATKPSRTELKISREQRYELINQAVRKLQQPIAKSLRPSHRSIESSQSTASRTRWINPSVLAFYQSGKWEFFIELPKQYIDHEGTVHAIQGKNLLNRQEDDLFGPLYYLDTAIEIILHKSQGRIKNLISLISNKDPILIFRLIENDSEWKGTLISRSAKGFYLVVAPSDWKRDEEAGGQPPIDPESLETLHFTAHYFDTQQGQFITFLKPDGKRHQSKPKKYDLILDGKTIDDDDEKRLGPLFYDEPPIVLGDQRSWGNIRSIVVGEEGHGQWREQYDVATFRKWQIPSLGPKGKSGWFFLRFYDDTGCLVNSLFFRFIAGLKSIQKSVSVFPGYRNERPARIEFDITEKIQVIPIKDSPKIELEIDKIHDKMIFMCQPSPNIKKLNFEVQEKNGRPVRVAFDVDRIWWRICNEQINHDFIEWSASLLSKAKSAFSPTTGEILELHLPLSLVRQPIKIGFRREKSLNLQVSIKEQIGKAPLHWFYDEVSEKKVGIKELGVWIGKDQESNYYKILECITHASCQFCAKTFDEKWTLLDHLLNDHDTQLFQNLMIKRDRELELLPRKLYVCLLDGMFFAGDPMRRDCLPREMENHFRDKHPNDRMSFRVIDDPDAIQRIKGYQLEQVWKCLICEDILVPPSDDPAARSIKRQHLHGKHQHQIYQLTD